MKKFAKQSKQYDHTKFSQKDIIAGMDTMRAHYDFSKMKGKKNPFLKTKNTQRGLPFINNTTIALESLRSKLNQYVHKMHFDQAKRIEKQLESLEKRINRLEILLRQDDRSLWLKKMGLSNITPSTHTS